MDRKIIKAYNKTRPAAKRQRICHAPFRSMRFTITGNVLACCYNRYQVLGSYPSDKLNDIWFGKNIIQLRSRLENNDLNLGCQRCLHDIESRNFYSTGARFYDYLPEKKAGYPVMLDFEIDNTCNLECVMCSGENSSLIRKNREKKPPYPIPYDHDFISQLKEFFRFIQEARFVGGEPFPQEMNYRIWEQLMEINPGAKISVLTNGTILNDRIRELLVKGNFHISVSIDSLQKETYEKIRVNADFEKVMENMAFFMEDAKQNERPFCINVCPMPYNWQDIPGLFNFANQKNIHVFLHTVVFPPHASLRYQPPEKLQEIISFMEKQKLKGFSKVQRANKKTFSSFISQLKGWHNYSNENRDSAGLLTEDFHTLKEMLFKKISEYIVSTGDHEKDLLFYTGRLEEAFTATGSEETCQKAIVSILQLEPRDIVAELEISNTERLVERIIAA
ncbi:MAG: radical SAM protein, partial [Bacteroidota bacterium]